MPAHAEDARESKWNVEFLFVCENFRHKGKRVNAEPCRKHRRNIRKRRRTRNSHVRLRAISIVGKSAVWVLCREYVAHTSAQSEPNVRSTVTKTLIQID